MSTSTNLFPPRRVSAVIDQSIPVNPQNVVLQGVTKLPKQELDQRIAAEDGFDQSSMLTSQQQVLAAYSPSGRANFWAIQRRCGDIGTSSDASVITDCVREVRQNGFKDRDVTIVDLACGDWAITIEAMKLFQPRAIRKVVGVDLCPPLVAQMGKTLLNHSFSEAEIRDMNDRRVLCPVFGNAACGQTDFIDASVATPVPVWGSPTEKTDLVIATGIVHHLPTDAVKEAIACIGRRLEPAGGRFVIELPPIPGVRVVAGVDITVAAQPSVVRRIGFLSREQIEKYTKKAVSTLRKKLLPGSGLEIDPLIAPRPARALTTDFEDFSTECSEFVERTLDESLLEKNNDVFNEKAVNALRDFYRERLIRGASSQDVYRDLPFTFTAIVVLRARVGSDTKPADTAGVTQAGQSSKAQAGASKVSKQGGSSGGFLFGKAATKQWIDAMGED